MFYGTVPWRVAVLRNSEAPWPGGAGSEITVTFSVGKAQLQIANVHSTGLASPRALLSS